MAKKRDQPDKLTELFETFDDSLLGDNLPRLFTDNSVKVERILLDMVRPDPIQPRRVLPDPIHHKFHNGNLTPTQSLREIVQLAQVSARQNGRPFSNVVELLPDPEKDDDTPLNLSPEEIILRDLVHLAITVRDDGQVNPLTVVDVSEGVVQQYRIETGERRYWAAWILRDFVPGYDSDGMIDCIAVPAEKSSVFRQAKENTARKGLTAIAMARQAALLLLTVHGYEIPNHAVNNDFYRQALELDLRGKREYTDAIYSAMGGIDKRRFSRYKALLKLSDEAMELADRHSVDEYVLRQMVDMPDIEHTEILQHIINFGLSAKQVRELCHPSDDDKTEDQSDIPKQTRQLVKLVLSIKNPNASDIAKGLIEQEANVAVARARLNNLRLLLDEAERYLHQ